MRWLVIAVALAAPSAAAQAASAPAFDPALYLPPPPAAGSAQAMSELAELKRIEAAATPDQLAAAAYDDKHEDGTIFAAAIGPGFDLDKLPVTAKMIKAVGDAEEEASSLAKKEFHRDRPWIVDPAVTTCTPHKQGPAANSYPSGHATVGFAMAIVLANVIPDKAPAILGRASQFAENRLVCGYHFRSDIIAGQQFGTLLTLELMQDRKFRSEMTAARAELRAAHLGP